MRRTFVILVFSVLSPLCAFAQWSFDVPSIEAYIADHKDQKSLLLARATLEQANTLLHGYSRDANVTYKEINVELDKYTRAFDVIDIMYQTLRTSLNTYDTYETFKQRIEDYKVMLTAFWDKCLSQGDIVSTDQLIITVNRSLLERLSEEGQGIYRSFSDLVLYATGAAACSASIAWTSLTFFFNASSAADFGSLMAASARLRSVSRSSHAMRAKVVSTRSRGLEL